MRDRLWENGYSRSHGWFPDTERPRLGSSFPFDPEDDDKGDPGLSWSSMTLCMKTNLLAIADSLISKGRRVPADLEQAIRRYVPDWKPPRAGVPGRWETGVAGEGDAS
jgi:hypothetical protein